MGHSPTSAATDRTKVTTTSNGAPLKFKRTFTKEGVHPFNEVTWVKRDAVIAHGENIKFQQKDVEFPSFWSPNAVNITVSKYFRGKLNTPARETSLKQMLTRVVSVFRAWGVKNGYFENETEAEIFEHELTYILLHQMASFNSPVWFNVGTLEVPQCSACFILKVEDSMPSILEWISTEGMIFKRGSGAGVSLSKLRSSRESLTEGGRASGPVSFMRGADSVAGMIASGGVTRRAAKMVVLGIDHPDIPEFINCKAHEEDKVRALAEAGFNMADLNDEAWKSIQFQNANNSVRVTDDFMQAVEKDGEWQTHFIKDGEVADTYKARDLMHQIAEAAWKCGDPGIHFDTTINNWHTIPECGRINSTNPCAEYNSVDDSACNLASINLLKYLREDGSFKTEEFKATVDTMILAQDISVCGSSFPTERITRNARAQRQLGLGFANLGAFLMMKGLAYDSDEARAWTGAITSVMGGEAYRYSTVLAERVGTFEDHPKNAKPMLNVIGMHRNASRVVDYALVSDKMLATTSQQVWNEAYERGGEHGYRNSQVTVIAPTGTISFMMGCSTTGPEPCFSLVAMKQLVGGGWMKIVNDEVTEALRRLGYTDEQCTEMVEYVVQNQTIENAPHLKEEHLPVFDCAVQAGNGTRSISWQGHVKMVAAIQPFISGAISKTFNMPHETTVEEIEDAYMMAWKMGIKVFAVYRDGSKATQPLQTTAQKKGKTTTETEAVAPERLPESWRQRMPATRISETHKFSVAGHEGFLTYGMYANGQPGEIFIRMAKTGSAMGGLLDAFALAVSLTLQYGVPLKKLARKFINTRYEPAGFTDNADIRIATSLTDYIFRYLAMRFLPNDELEDLGIPIPQRELPVEATEAASPAAQTVVATQAVEHATPETQTIVSGSPKPAIADTLCRSCGGMMIRTGTCNTCLQCGTSSGGC